MGDFTLIYIATWKLLGYFETAEKAHYAGLVVCGGPSSFVVVPVADLEKYPIRTDVI
jgi:hypothetical protein